MFTNSNAIHFLPRDKNIIVLLRIIVTSYRYSANIPRRRNIAEQMAEDFGEKL